MPAVIRRTVSALLAVAALALAVAAVAPATASAHVPHPVNGCSFSPDRPGGFNFKPACDAHDVCYGHKPWGNSIYGRLMCDRRFRSDLYVRCYMAGDGGLCPRYANAYFDAVRDRGCYAFQGRSPGWAVFRCSDRFYR